MEHIGSIKDGYIIKFKENTHYFMKVCSSDGIGGVVDLITGKYTTTSNIEKEGMTPYAEILCDSFSNMIDLIEQCEWW